MNTRTFNPADAALSLLTGMSSATHSECCALTVALAELLKKMGHTAAVDYLDCAHESMEYSADMDVLPVDEDARAWHQRAAQ